MSRYFETKGLAKHFREANCVGAKKMRTRKQHRTSWPENTEHPSMTSRETGRRAKKKRKAKLTEKNGWCLYSGLYQVKWKNGVADEVEIAGVRLKVQPWGRL